MCPAVTRSAAATSAIAAQLRRLLETTSEGRPNASWKMRLQDGDLATSACHALKPEASAIRSAFQAGRIKKSKFKMVSFQTWRDVLSRHLRPGLRLTRPQRDAIRRNHAAWQLIVIRSNPRRSTM
jgi:hypothetical protein